MARATGSGEIDAQAFARHDGARPSGVRLEFDVDHEGIVVIGIVTEDCERLRVGGLTQAYAFLPGGMAPVDLAHELGVGIGRIIDREIGAFDQTKDVLVGPAWHMLGIKVRRARIGDAAAHTPKLDLETHASRIRIPRSIAGYTRVPMGLTAPLGVL